LAILDNFFYTRIDTVKARRKRWGLATSRSYPDAGRLQLAGWFFPAWRGPGDGAAPARQRGNMTGHFQHVRGCGRRLNVLCFDYRGYGRSEGKVTRPGTLRDACSAMDWVLARPGVDPEADRGVRQSLGGAIACVLAPSGPR